MKKYHITQIDSIVYHYVVEAENEEEAREKWYFGHGHLPEYDKMVDRQIEVEEGDIS